MTLKYRLMVSYRVPLCLIRIAKMIKVTLINNRGLQTRQLVDRNGVATLGVKLVPFFRDKLLP